MSVGFGDCWSWVSHDRKRHFLNLKPSEGFANHLPSFQGPIPRATLRGNFRFAGVDPTLGNERLQLRVKPMKILEKYFI